MAQHGDQRSAAHGKLGHQKTPSFIAAVVENAIAAVCGSPPAALAKGGFTDVGLHTGGKARDTAWALVLEASCALLCDLSFPVIRNHCRPYLHLLLVHILAWALGEHMEVTESSVLCVDVGVSLLSELCSIGSVLAEQRYIVEGLAQFCCEQRAKLEHHQSNCAQAQMSLFTLPSTSDLQSVFSSPEEHVQHFSFTAPDSPRFTAASSSSQVLSRATATIQPREVQQSGDEICTLHSWLLQHTDTDWNSLLLRFHTCKHALFTACCHYLPRGSCALSLSHTQLEECVSIFRQCTNSIVGHPGSSEALGLARIYSVETLGIWIAACLLHKLVVTSHPHLQAYRLPLDFRKLQQLVLEEAAANGCLLIVSEYCQRYLKGDSMAMFSTIDFSATRAIAQAEVMANPDLMQFHKDQQNNAGRLMEERWKKVLEKKKWLKDLRVRLQKAKNKRDAYIPRYHYDYGYQNLAAVVTQLEQSIDEANSPPPVCILPFPQGSTEANVVVFFAKGSDDIHALASLLYMAQQLIFPRGPYEDFPGIPYSVTWASHLINHGVPHCANRLVFLVWDQYTRIPQQVGPCTVDEYRSPSDGVWWPDDCGQKLAWQGGNLEQDKKSVWFNPFFTPDQRKISCFFTAALRFPCLQWAMYTWSSIDNVSDLARSNLGLCRQKDRPQWLSPLGFQAFTTMRAGAHQQLRHVACALHDRQLPLHEPAVHSLILQTLYHVGPFCSTGTGAGISLAWKRDLHTGDFLSQLTEEVAATLSQLQCKVREHQAMLLLGELAGFIRQYNGKDLRQECASVCDAWTQDAVKQLAKVEAEVYVDPRQVHEMRSRECLFSGYALLCYHTGPLSREDAATMLKFAVRMRQGLVFADGTPLKDVVRSTELKCENALAARAYEILQLLDDAALTAALNSVVEGSHSSLTWTRITPCSTAFHAHASAGAGPLYSLNVLTGLVLVDGYPLQTLPQSVLSHKLYQRCFGDRRFEVSREGSQWTTTRTLHGFCYQFELDEADGLHVTEVDTAAQEVLTLNDMINLPDKLPKRVTSMGSFWYSAKHTAIVVRPLCFQEHHPLFLATGVGTSSCRLFTVSQRKTCHWLELLQLADSGKLSQLVTPTSPTLRRLVELLSKFDTPDFIHVVLQPVPRRSPRSPVFTLQLQLPRFQQHFDIRADGCVASLDRRGFFLSGKQLLPCLSRFTGYLVVVGDSGVATELLVPDGTVHRKDNGEVSVQVSREPDAQLNYMAYRWKERLHLLHAHDNEARLHLAALLAASGTLLAEPALGVTGADAALQLVRRSFPSRPLSQAEAVKLQSVAQYSAGFPCLAVLCQCLAETAGQLHCLYPPPADAVAFYNKDVATEYCRKCTSNAGDRRLPLLLPRKRSLHSTRFSRVPGTIN
eukprot:TRINITY_DN1122_c1_g1_i1.p1 TRINITY_DN1122_c1_g1~~TRINITY_DN1122_c1_g1_i1.p1  ORF type:complete len:1532 (-),score=233.20 TRINITY_DN1122_c1_g1_i1:843-5000(-)